jgi:hypothetical protein
MDEVHVFRRQRQGFPVEPAFQEQRPPGVPGALEALLQFGAQTLKLLAG